VIVAFAGQKGGVGKTTTSVCVAAELQARGASVLVVDADPQLSARTWSEVATEAGHPSPTCISLGANLYEPNQLPRLARDYTHTVIDCPPRHGEIQRAALMVADLCVLPCGPTAVEAWALVETTRLVTEARVVRPTLSVVVLLTKTNPRTSVGRDARSVVTESGLPVLAVELTSRVAYQEALAAGRGVTTYAPRDAAAAQVRRLVDELLGLDPRAAKGTGSRRVDEEAEGAPAPAAPPRAGRRRPRERGVRDGKTF
jgi:chromosome partitioning protein